LIANSNKETKVTSHLLLDLADGFFALERVLDKAIRLEISAAEYEEILENLQIIN
jgi:hypothetical protein